LRTLVVVTVLVALLAGAMAVACQGWFAFEAVDIGFHGTLALVLGVSLSLFVGIGLMSLVFFSSRSGRDNIADWHRQGAAGPEDDP